MKNSFLCIAIAGSLFFTGCSASKQINRQAQKALLKNLSFHSAHVGISIYEPATERYWYNYQDDKYFVPASNTKLVTCYAAMKHLGDSLVGLRYRETNNEIIIYGSGDPTFLHPEFTQQRVFDFLKNTDKKIVFNNLSWNEKRWGAGWSWDDYSDYYMPERSALPVYGNIIRISSHLNNLYVLPPFFKKDVTVDGSLNRDLFPATVKRDFYENQFIVSGGRPDEHYTETPFHTDDSIIMQLLGDTLQKNITRSDDTNKTANMQIMELHSRPTDSMLRPLMYQSDNFFAEQTLLMVSQKILGFMSDEKIIDTLLKTDFKDLPQKPNWVDGSGLSHYNLFSPKDFVMILDKMKNDFGMDRIKNVLATGGTGTIKNYYKADSGFIYAKTGTLSGVVAFSGFLYTKKNRLLIFSTLVNNHHSSPALIRTAIEKFLEEIRNKN